MKKIALLAVVVGSLVAADVAQAGVFRRGGCPGGVCGVSLATTVPSAPPAVAATPAAPPAPTTAGAPAESTPVAAQAAPSDSTRFARLRGLGRRR